MSVVVVLVFESLWRGEKNRRRRQQKKMAWSTFSVLLFHSHDIIHVDKRNLDAFGCLPKSLDYVEDSEGTGVLCSLCSSVLIINL